jgi:putative acetyltransferase
MINVRQANVDDAEALLVLERALAEAKSGMVTAPDQVRTIEKERERLAPPTDASLAIVAEIDGRIAGNAGLKQLAPMRCKHVGVLFVGVHPDFQRRGVGRALMQHLIAHAKAQGLVRLELYVRSDNHKAQALYESLGFSHEGTRVKFVLLDDGSYIDDFIYALFL